MNKLIDKGIMALLGQLGGSMQLMSPKKVEFQILRAKFAGSVNIGILTNLPDDADDATKKVEVEIAYMHRATEKVRAEGMKNIAKIVKKAIQAKNRDNIAMWAYVSKLSRADTARMSDEFRLAVEIHRRRVLEKQLHNAVIQTKQMIQRAENAAKVVATS